MKWVGVCVGFKGIFGIIDCYIVNNIYICRLCLCFDFIGKLVCFFLN